MLKFFDGIADPHRIVDPITERLELGAGELPDRRQRRRCINAFPFTEDRHQQLGGGVRTGFFGQIDQVIIGEPPDGQDWCEYLESIEACSDGSPD